MDLFKLPEPISLRDLVIVNEQSASRTPGLHLTDIIKRILVKIDPKRYGGFEGKFPIEMSENWQEAGFLWEDVLSRVFEARISTERAHESAEGVRWRPGELVKDGIIGSPDGFCLQDRLDIPARGTKGKADYAPAYTIDQPLIVEEYKCTWKSANNFDLYDKRYLWWLLQLQGYCAMAGTCYARLYVFHVNGDYQGYLPMTTAHLLVFPEMELRDQWASFLNTARKEGLLIA